MGITKAYSLDDFEETNDMERISGQKVCEELGISKMTLYKWMLQGKVKFRRLEISGRTHLFFSRDEVNRIKGSIVKKREPGKSLIQP